MKISTDTAVTIERSSLATDGSFTIDFNAKMAKILSDGLYSDKIKSIIRELSCNAVDSHVESGQPNLPIEVHLPSIFEPWFYVKDFGVGLDHTQILNHFTRYGASTKTNSNDYIGQLGLGCKSPFSYVDAFDVTSVKNGIRRQYSMYKNEDGMPSVALLGETSSNEPNGVTVKLPVKREDIHQFCSKAVQVFMWFNTRPTIKGVSSLSYPTTDTLISGNGWSLREIGNNYNDYSTRKLIALMGRVAYPIYAGSISNSNLPSCLFDLPLTIEFNIGDLEVSASRESIGYDKRTQANIVSKLSIVAEEICKIITDKFSNAKTEFEARKIYYQIFHNKSWSSGAKDLFPNGVQWNAIKIDSSILSVHFDKLAVYSSTKRRSGISLVRDNYNNEKINFDCSGRTHFFVDDLPRGGIERTKYHIKTNNINDANLIALEDNLTVADLIAKCPGLPITLTSSLPLKPKTKSSNQKISTFLFNSSYDTWSATEIDMDNGGIYVDLIRLNNQIEIKKDLYIEVSNFSTLIRIAKTLKLIDSDQQIYGIKRDIKKIVQSHDDWENLFDIINDYLTKNITDVFKQKLANYPVFHRYQYEFSAMANTNFVPKNPSSPLAEFLLNVKHLSTVSNMTPNEHHLQSLVSFMQMNLSLPKSTIDLKSLVDKINDTYPLLDVLCRQVSNTWKYHGKQIINYIDDVDTANMARKSQAQSID